MSAPSGPGPKDPLWRKGDRGPGAPGEPRASNRRQLYVALALLLALLGATAAWIFYPRRLQPPKFIGVWIDQYNDVRIPPNAFAANDRKAFSDLGLKDAGAFTSQERGLFRDMAQQLRKHPAGEALIVLLSAHVITRPNGKVFVLPGDARLEDETTWVPLEEVLDYLRECPSRRKLLILDLMQPFTAPRFGVLADDVPARVRATLDANAAQDPDLLTLMACAPGQHSLASPELGHTAFVYYLREGLRGRADGYGKRGNPDGRISVRELAAFVTARVDRWAQQTRGTRQTPQLAGSVEDFDLIAIATTTPGGPAELATPAYSKDLLARWQKRDQLRQGPGPGAAPNLLGWVESVLLEAERRLDDGAEAAVIERRVKEVLAPLEKRYQAWKETLPPLPLSLESEVARAGGKAPDAGPAAVDAYNALLTLAEEVQAAAQPDEKKVAKPDEKKVAKLQMDRAALLKDLKAKPLALTWMMLEELTREPQISHGRIQFVHGLLAEAKGPAYEETEFLKRLATRWKGTPKDWPASAAKQALTLVRTAAQIETTINDPRVLPWVKPLLETADKERREAEGVFFNPDSTPEDIRARLEKARKAFLVVKDRQEVVGGAFLVYDDAVVRLSGHARYLEEEPEQEGDWTRAVAETHELSELLRVPPDTIKVADEAVRKIGNVSDTLQKRLKGRLLAPVDRQFREVIERKDKANAADGAKMNALLRLPGFTADERLKLWQLARETSRRLHKELVQLDAREDSEERQTPAPQPVTAAPPARDLALLQARTWKALLRLYGVIEIKGLEDAYTRAAREPSGQASDRAAAEMAWLDLSERLRRAWAQPATGGPGDLR
ncbi:MAG: caspase family protein [Gemmataceae bacterium]|nr:caspase family protein [Gemmataceae bacterium]